MRILVFEPGNVIYTKKISGNLRSIQEVVGGNYIATAAAIIKYRKVENHLGPFYTIVHDSMGFSSGKFPNHGYHGTFFVCRHNDVALEGLSKKEIDLILEEL